MQRILVVEDEDALREAITELLDDEGYTPIPARHGREALAALEREPIDLIVMDVMMPIMDGITTVHRLRQREALPPPILLMSAGSNRMVAGLDVPLLRKPFELEDLLSAVSALLSASSTD